MRCYRILCIALTAIMLAAPVAGLSGDTSSAKKYDSPTPGLYLGAVPLQGFPGPGVTIHVDNTAKTLRSLLEAAGGTWFGGTDNVLAPIGALIVCRTSAINFYFGGSTPTFTEGVPFAAESSFIVPGPEWVSTMKLISTSASDNVACPTHLLY